MWSLHISQLRQDVRGVFLINPYQNNAEVATWRDRKCCDSMWQSRSLRPRCFFLFCSRAEKENPWGANNLQSNTSIANWTKLPLHLGGISRHKTNASLKTQFVEGYASEKRRLNARPAWLNRHLSPLFCAGWCRKWVHLEAGSTEYTKCAIPRLTHRDRVIKAKENAGLFLDSLRFGN